MLALTRTPRRWARAFAAWVAIVGPAGCGDGSGGLTPTPQTQHVLRVQASGAGSGTVIAPDASPPLSCTITSGALSGVCASAYPSNAAVLLIATPNGASTFVGWSGACTGTGECVVDMSQERTATASFAPPPGRVTQMRQEITFGFGARIRGVVPNSLLIASMRVPTRLSSRACAASVSVFSSVVRSVSPAVGA